MIELKFAHIFKSSKGYELLASATPNLGGSYHQSLGYFSSKRSAANLAALQGLKPWNY